MSNTQNTQASQLDAALALDATELQAVTTAVTDLVAALQAKAGQGVDLTKEITMAQDLGTSLTKDAASDPGAQPTPAPTPVPTPVTPVP